MNETAIRAVVEEVLSELGKNVRSNGRPAASPPNGRGIPVKSAGAPGSLNPQSSTLNHSGNWGVFATVDEAVAAANDGFQQLARKSMADRAKVVQIVKDLCAKNAADWGRKELEETKIGRLDHKIEKLQIIKLVPGTEWIKSDCYSGDHGLTVEEYAPFGVIGAITPATHSLPTLAGNVVNMVAAGNAIVFNPHPSGTRIACEGVQAFNKAIAEAIGIENL